jgi:uncharacterized protein YecE (DUF72 family)
VQEGSMVQETSEAPRRAATEKAILVGTSGFSYPEWKGTFYPPDLPQARMLEYYADRLPAVEINNTFYRMPKAELLEKWATQVPAGFVFVLKAPQRITHMRRLKDAGPDLTFFLQQGAAIKDRLGPLLFQLPPHLRKDVSRLDGFLDLLPAGVQAAFEFRHASWLDEEVFAALTAHDVALCLSETDDEPAPITATASWGYLRLRRERYADGDLERWAAFVQAQRWSRSFVFFKHEDAGAGPRLATRFAQLVLPAT